MLADNLGAVNRTPEISDEEVAEALALTKLAYFNTVELEPRVVTAFSRAFGATVRLHPRALPVPGFVVSTAELPHRKTMTVAIEGTTNIDQIDDILSFNNRTFSGIYRAWFYTVFWSAAEQIWAQIHASNTYMGYINSGHYMFTFTGHSLGAAVADCIAFKWRQTYPNKPVRIIKFGCPRVGSPAYVNRTTDSVPQRRNLYCSLDPIHQFPSALVFSIGLINVGNTLMRINAVSESFGTEFLRDGTTQAQQIENTMSCGHFLDVASLGRALTPENPWYSHLMKTYRLYWMHYCNRVGGRLKYRFNYLEFPDENSWQVRYNAGLTSWSSMENSPKILPVAPDPVLLPPALVTDTIQRAATDGDAFLRGEVGGGDLARVENPMAAAPAILPAITTNQLPRRHQPRTVPR